MPTSSIDPSSVAQPSPPAGFHSLPPEMVQEILGYLDASDLLAFEVAQFPPAVLPPVFNRMARDFIAAREQNWPSRPWPSRAIPCCYAWVREQFEGTDEQFAQSYPDAVTLMQIVSVSQNLEQLSAEVGSRLSCRDLPIVEPEIHAPVTISSTGEFAFPILDQSGTLSLVTIDGTIICPPELSGRYPMQSAAGFPIVSSMRSHGDTTLIVSRRPPEQVHERYHPLTNTLHPLPRELQTKGLRAASENDRFVAAASQNSDEGKSKLVVSGSDRTVTDKTLSGNVESVCVDSEGVAVVCVREDHGDREEELLGMEGRHASYAAYEVKPGGLAGPPVRLLVNDFDELVAPGYVLAAGESGVIQSGPEAGDLTLRSRRDGSALILSPRDPACASRSFCMGPAQALALATYSKESPDDDGPERHFVAVFDLTSVSGKPEEALLPKVWIELPDAVRSPVACLTRDAGRLTVAYKSYKETLRLVNVDLSPERNVG